MRVYIAGPMTGIADYNYPAFADAEAALRRLGHEPVSPAGELIDGWDWKDYMRRSLRLLLSCQAITLLDGWETSRGASTEAGLAAQLEMPVVYLDVNRAGDLSGWEIKTAEGPDIAPTDQAAVDERLTSTSRAARRRIHEKLGAA